jgi:CubicO group peptidase (beta-lactamase class C family)
VSTNSLVDGWPGAPAAVVLKLDGGVVHRVAQVGDLDDVRPWASVSKMAVSLAFGIESDWDLHKFDEPAGPRGATIANLLSHSSGLGLEEGDAVVDVATKRIYSNYGVDLATHAILGEHSAQSWLAQRLFTPFGMNATRLEGRPSSGVVGSTNDLVRMAVAWLRPDAISKETRNYLIAPYAPQLSGIVPVSDDSHPVRGDSDPKSRGETSLDGGLAGRQFRALRAERIAVLTQCR